MKRKNLFLMGSMVTLLIVAFMAGTVYAASGCFKDTNNKPFSLATCWMKQNGLAKGKYFNPSDYTTRAQAAVWLQKASQIPPTEGLIMISESPSNWRPMSSADDLTFDYYSSGTYVKKTTTGSSFITVQNSIPTVLYGRSLQFLGVEFCYEASANVAINYIEINTYTHTTGPGSRNLRLSDSTSRTDANCLYYQLPTPVTLTAEDGVSFYAYGNWSVANSPLVIGRTTFVLAPTGVKAAVPVSATVVSLQEGGTPPDGSSTSAP